MFTTDQGPDQVAASKLLQRDVEESVTDIVIAQWLLAHVFHLMVKFQVQQLYNGKYFGSLAKVVNLWRSRGNPKKIREGLRHYHHDHGDRATDTRALCPTQRIICEVGASSGLVEHDSVECCFQPAGFLHLKEILHKGLACTLAQKNNLS